MVICRIPIVDLIPIPGYDSYLIRYSNIHTDTNIDTGIGISKGPKPVIG